MKKLFIMSLVFVASFTLLTGCGSNSYSDNNTEVSTTENETEQPTTEQPTTAQPTTAEPETVLIPSLSETEDIFLPSNMRMGMAPAEIKDNEKRELNRNLSNGNTEYISYKGTSPGFYDDALDCVYCVTDNKLVSYWCSFDKESYKVSNKYFDVYQEVKDIITNKYGDCVSEDISWTDETYKDDEEMWNKAFEYGYVTINTRWQISDDDIILIRWNYADGLKVITTTEDNEKNL